jgi:Inositol hexakisphosphate
MKRPSDTPVVFNCHSGTGRSSVGMVVACLLRACRLREHCDTQHKRSKLQRFRSLRSLVAVDGLAQHRMGEYQIILDLLRVLPGGLKTKARLFTNIIESCACVYEVCVCVCTHCVCVCVCVCWRTHVIRIWEGCILTQ